MVDLLRRYGATTPVWELSAEEMKESLRSGSDVVGDPTFVEEALARNDVELAELLAEHVPERFARIDGGSLRCGDPDASLRSSDVLRRLLELGVDPNRRDWVGKTALHHYAGRGDVGNLKLLLQNGAAIDAVDDEPGGTPLAFAAQTGKGDAVRVLLEHGADPRLPEDREWAQPLRRAESGGHPELVAMLRQALSSGLQF